MQETLYRPYCSRKLYTESSRLEINRINFDFGMKRSVGDGSDPKVCIKGDCTKIPVVLNTGIG